MTPRPNINRPRPVTYLELEYARWHPKPMGKDFTRQRYGVDWTHIMGWSVMGAVVALLWVAIYLLALYVVG